MDLAAQIISIVGMLFNLLIFQQKTHKGALTCQLFAAVTFGVSYFMLGAVAGCMLNAVGAVRALVFMFKEKTNANHIFWLIFFIIAFAASYPLSFLVFGKEMILKNFIIELLPVLAMIIATLSLRVGSARAIRKFGLVSSPMWLVYNVFCFSIGAIASEILNLISMVVGIIRFDIKKDAAESADSESKA